MGDRPDDPRLAAIIGATFVVFLIGATLQVMRIRARARKFAGAAVAGNPG